MLRNMHMHQAGSAGYVCPDTRRPPTLQATDLGPFLLSCLTSDSFFHDGYELSMSKFDVTEPNVQEKQESRLKMLLSWRNRRGREGCSLRPSSFVSP